MPSITATGAEYRLNQLIADNQFQVVTAPRAGGFAAFWSSPVIQVSPTSAAYANADIKGRFFNADGTPAGDEFTVNTNVAGVQYRPNVTTLTDGHLLVTWQDGANPGTGSTPATIRAQEFGADGTRVGDEFAIAGPGTLAFPNLAPLAGGGFVSLWQVSGTNDILLQRYDATNAPIGNAITIAGTSASFDRPDVAVLANGNTVVAWVAAGMAGVSARIYDIGGNQVGTEFTDYFQFAFAARVTALSDGAFVLTASSNNGNFGYSIHEADGTTRADGQIAGAGTSGYDIASAGGGDFVLAYTQGATDSDIAAVLIRGNGNVVGAPIIVNAETTGTQGGPVLARLDNGDFIVSWTDNSGIGGDTSGFGLKARLLDFTITPNTAPTAVNDSFNGYFFNNIDATVLLDNDSDVDGDTLTITGVSNARSGTVTLSNGIIAFTPNAGFTGPAVFDYTISDGAGGTATATATFIGSRNDAFTVRGAGPHILDVLANDFLAPRPQGYLYTANVAQNDGRVLFVNTAVAPRLYYNPIETIFPEYFNQVVGQSKLVTVTYSVIDPSTGLSDFVAQAEITLQGWAQLGGTGADTFIGTAEADHLSGGTGAANRLEGGGGDDWYTVAAMGDVIVEGAGAGTDNVRAIVQAFELSANVENLTYTGNTGDFTGIGNAANNRLTGGNFNDTLIGLGGDDTLFGGNGTDLLFGGTGNDIYIVGAGDIVFEDADGGVDTVNSGDSFYLFANIENLNLAQGNVAQYGVGNASDNTINGNNIANLLIGGGGNDTLDGKADNDLLFGETGDDTLIGGAGIDYLVGGTGNDRLEGGTDADALYGQDGNDILVGGSDFQTDILVGGDGNDTLNAASGLGDYDLIDGGAGDDVYYVDTPADLTFEAIKGGTDTIVANIVGAGYYLYANTENLILDGVTPFGVGNELDNNLTGNAIGNYLLGGQGNDTLNGKAGNDVLFGESGADTFIFERGTGGDVIGDFQPGTDKINLINLGFTNYAQLQANIFEVAGTTAINLGQGDFIVINGITNSALSAVDFQFG